VITHSIAGPQRSYSRPTYGDVVTEVRSFLTAKVELAVSLGVPEERLVVDPGHDLNKTTRHSLELTRRLAEISSIGLPVLAAVSNKDFIGESTGTAAADRLSASLAAATVCILNGARIIRMHDVAASVQAATMVEAVLGLREPAYVRHNLT
jgi:dihydropteroate synthase